MTWEMNLYESAFAMLWDGQHMYPSSSEAALFPPCWKGSASQINSHEKNLGLLKTKAYTPKSMMHFKAPYNTAEQIQLNKLLKSLKKI